ISQRYLDSACAPLDIRVVWNPDFPLSLIPTVVEGSLEISRLRFAPLDIRGICSFNLHKEDKK
ncbi:hypothetical protein, partial [Anaerococcus sp.]|uniref:hypothetical protein n=1 Tax=Anaerococcus sp. TaxID=1872515 RepID=UPI002A747B80